MTTRDRILDGAVHVMRTRGLAHATTKEIAKAAGFSEATLYKTFADKVDLFLCVLAERLPRIDLVRGTLTDQVGRAGVADTLRAAVEQTLAYYLEAFPMNASLFADAALLARHRDGVLARGAGPARIHQAFADYLRAEQSAGRVSAAAAPDAVASALVGACLHRAFLLSFGAEPPDPHADARFVTALLATVLPTLALPASRPS